MTTTPSIQSFVGRRGEMQWLRARIDEGARLLTIVGPGGIGKTRLANELSRTLKSTREVYTVLLADVRDADGVLIAVRESLGFSTRFRTSQRVREHLADRLAGMKSPILLLDNAEHVMDGVCELLAFWLSHVPTLTVVATSRERLRLHEELCLELGPLALPSDADPNDDTDAVTLFALRARSHRAEFSINARNREAIRAIVCALQGIPLAIELAAARVAVLGEDALRERLQSQLDVLVARSRSLPARHATLRATLEWSWQLLSPTEQSVLSQCSVFHGTWDLVSAEAVVASPSNVLESLFALRDKSLLRSVEPGRFQLFDVVREFAAEKLLESGIDEATRARHATWFVGQSVAQAERHDANGGAASLQQLTLWRENLELAIAYTNGEQRARGLAALLPVVLMHGPLERYSAALSSALESCELPTLRARLLRARGCVRAQQGHAEDARLDLEDAISTARDEPLFVARTQVDRGVWAHQRHDLDDASRWYLAALPHFEKRGDRRAQGRVLGNLGAVEHDRGALDAAIEKYERALELLRDVGEARWEGIFRTNMGVLEQERGRFDRARVQYDRALVLLREGEDPRLVAITEGNIGLLEQEMGRVESARRRHQRALEGLVRAGDLRSEALCRARLGAAHALCGDLEFARDELARAEDRVERVGDLVVQHVLSLNRWFLEWTVCKVESLPSPLERVRESIEKVSSLCDADGRLLISVSDDLRTTVRMLRALASMPSKSARLVLSVTRECDWIRLPDGQFQALGSHSNARRILCALVEQHALDRNAPGLTFDQLVSAGWPDEKIQRDAAANRLHVALHFLRTRGLKLWIKRRDGRYALAHELEITTLATDEIPATLQRP